jgi:hypothetical protein
MDMISYKGRTYNPHKLSRIYRNLNRKGFVLSIQQQIGNRWLVIAHSNQLRLTNVSIYINDNIRERVRASTKKTPHAYLIAEKVSDIDSNEVSEQHLNTLPWITYNPYYDNYFIRNCVCDGRKVKTRFVGSNVLLITNNKIYEL